MMRSTLIFLIALLPLAASADVFVYSTGSHNYMLSQDGTSTYLGIACDDFYTEYPRHGRGQRFSPVVVYRNCDANWAASESIGAAQRLGSTCSDMRGEFTGNIAVYQNCNINWAVDVLGQVHELGTGCSDFQVFNKTNTLVNYQNCGQVWTVDNFGQLQ